MKKLFLLFFSVFICVCLHLFSVNEGNNLNFEFTKDELQEMGKWKEGTYFEIVNDALNGDRAALYMFGMGCLTGAMGLDINTSKADIFFSEAASLGFAPAIRQLIFSSLEDDNPFLVMVYWNLTASFGHYEMIPLYYERKVEFIEKFGKSAWEEVERIANEKKKLISSNIEELEEAQEKGRFVLNMKTLGKTINSDDSRLNSEYWFAFTRFKEEHEKEAILFQRVIQKNYLEFQSCYEKTNENMCSVIEAIESEKQTAGSTQLKFLKESREAIKKTEEFQEKLDDFHSSQNTNVQKFAKEFALLCQYAKDVLRHRHQFILCPNDYLDSSEKIGQLLDSTASVKQQVEHIEKMLEKTDED